MLDCHSRNPKCEPLSVNHSPLPLTDASSSQTAFEIQKRRPAASTWTRMDADGQLRLARISPVQTVSNMSDNSHHDYTTEDRRQPHLRPESSTTPNTRTRSTSYRGPVSLSGTHVSGLVPAGVLPIQATKPSQRNPYQYWQSHPHPGPSNLQRTSSGNQLQQPGGERPFSPPVLHPLAFRTKLPRPQSPTSASAQGLRDIRRSRAKFTIGSSRPNSPMEPDSKRGRPPAPFPFPFTIRGFLALSIFEKVVAVLFACCVFVLATALWGVGHSVERCRVCAHEVTNPGPESGSAPESFGVASGVDDSGFRIKDGIAANQRVGDQQPRIWMGRVEKTLGYQYSWKMGGYDIENDDVDDRYDDEYEHEGFPEPE